MTFEELDEQYAKLKKQYERRNQQFENGEIPAEVWNDELDAYILAFECINMLMDAAVNQLKVIKNETQRN